jgi:hypothetical protein
MMECVVWSEQVSISDFMKLLIVREELVNAYGPTIARAIKSSEWDGLESSV